MFKLNKFKPQKSYMIVKYKTNFFFFLSSNYKTISTLDHGMSYLLKHLVNTCHRKLTLFVIVDRNLTDFYL